MATPSGELVQELLNALQRRHRPRRRLRRYLIGIVSVLVISILTAGLAWLVAWKLPPRWIIARWQADWRLVDTDTAQQRTAYLPAFGEPGLRALVGVLADPRPPVRRAACDVLLAEVERWRTLPLSESSRWVAVVTEELAQVSASLPADVQDPMEQLLTDLVRWPLDPSRVDTVAVIGHCERALADLARHRLARAPGTVDVSADGVDQPTSTATRPGMENNVPPESSPSQALTTEWTGPSAVATVPVVRRSLSDDDEQGSSASGANPTALAFPGARSMSVENQEAGEPSGMSAINGEPESSLSPLLAPFARSVPPQRLQGQSPRTAPTVIPDGGPSVPVVQLSDWQLARLLASADASRAVVAAEELRRRGYSSRALAVLEMMGDDNPRRRLEALAELTSVGDLQPVPWLWHFLSDPDASVRQRAVAMLATDPSPESLHRLHQLRIRETDPQVLRVLRQVLKE